MPRFPIPKLAPVTLLSAAFLVSCNDSADDAGEPSESPPVKVVTAPVERRLLADTTLAIGTLRSFESVDLSSNVTERLESLHFEDGEEVTEGQVLAQLADDEEKAMMTIARSELSEEQREVARLGNLADREAVAKVTLDERRTQMAVAEARIEQIEAMLADRRILAPFDGVVGLRRISPGALVEPGTVITTIDQVDPMKLDFPIPELFLAEVEPGTNLAATIDAFPDESFDIEVTTVDSRIDPVTRSVVVRALLPNTDRRLRPGMLVKVKLQRNEREALTVPERAIVPVGDRQSVYLVRDDTAFLTPVTAGAREPGIVEIVEGVSEGDTVVTDGLLSLRDGAAVEVAGTYEDASPAFDPTSGDAE